MMIDADWMMISLDNLNYINKCLQPEDNFLLVFIFFCEMFLLNEIAREEGWLLRIF